MTDPTHRAEKAEAERESVMESLRRAEAIVRARDEQITALIQTRRELADQLEEERDVVELYRGQLNSALAPCAVHAEPVAGCVGCMVTRCQQAEAELKLHRQAIERIGEDVLPEPVSYSAITPEMVRDAAIKFAVRARELKAEAWDESCMRQETVAAVELYRDRAEKAEAELAELKSYQVNGLSDGKPSRLEAAEARVRELEARLNARASTLEAEVIAALYRARTVVRPAAAVELATERPSPEIFDQRLRGMDQAETFEWLRERSGRLDAAEARVQELEQERNTLALQYRVADEALNGVELALAEFHGYQKLLPPRINIANMLANLDALAGERDVAEACARELEADLESELECKRIAERLENSGAAVCSCGNRCDVPGALCWTCATNLQERADRAEAKVADLLGEEKEQMAHCSNCGVVLHCTGSQNEHEWEWHRRAEQAEARVREMETRAEQAEKEANEAVTNGLVALQGSTAYSEKLEARVRELEAQLAEERACLESSQRRENTMAASNTRECILKMRGRTLVGVVEGVLPRGDRAIASHCITLLWDDGTGLTISNAAWWSESREDVTLAIRELEYDLEDIRRQRADLVIASGARTA